MFPESLQGVGDLEILKVEALKQVTINAKVIWSLPSLGLPALLILNAQMKDSSPCLHMLVCTMLFFGFAFYNTKLKLRLNP